MNSFAKWAKESSNYNVRSYAEKLIEIGATWDTFGRERNGVVTDLCSEGDIPRLAAGDIISAASEAIKEMSRPLAIFWDIENVPIPSLSSGTEIVSKLKTILCPYGQIETFRAYASIGLNNIPEQKRSQLQLSGCHLVDSPHNGRKEVADKMIIVDAMEFAYGHMSGATICFITSDVDYAYLLAKLKKPHWKTIVITRQANNNSLLHANCDIRLCWDMIVPNIKTRQTVSPPPGFNVDVDILVAPSVDGGMSYKQAIGTCNGDIETTSGDIEPVSHGVCAFPEQGDVKLLRSLIIKHKEVGSPGPGTLKCHIVSVLRTEYYERFPDKTSIHQLISDSIVGGSVIEVDELGSRVLYLKENFNGKVPLPALSQSPPIPLKDMPQKIVGKSSALPFVLFLRRFEVPKGHKIPNNIMVQSLDQWLLLMFRTLKEAHSAMESMSYLTSGILINWNQVKFSKSRDVYEELKTSFTSLDFLCDSCEENKSIIDQFLVPGQSCYFCRECFESSGYWFKEGQFSASSDVTTLLEMMATYDDMFVPRNICRKSLMDRYASICGSRAQAALWIDAAIKSGDVTEVLWKGKGKSKGKVVCLTKYVRWTQVVVPNEEDFNMRKEVAFVKDLLWTRVGDDHLDANVWKKACIDKKDIIQQLRNAFPITMNSPLKRNILFRTAAKDESFFVAKGPFDQIVGITFEDAKASLRETISSVQQISSDNDEQDSSVSSKSSEEDIKLESFITTRKFSF